MLQTLVQYFIPQLRGLPILGLPLATNWLWTLNPSPAYVGQGEIQGSYSLFPSWFLIASLFT